jgi:hypothetical protein
VKEPHSRDAAADDSYLLIDLQDSTVICIDGSVAVCALTNHEQSPARLVGRRFFYFLVQRWNKIPA